MEHVCTYRIYNVLAVFLYLFIKSLEHTNTKVVNKVFFNLRKIFEQTIVDKNTDLRVTGRKHRLSAFLKASETLSTKKVFIDSKRLHIFLKILPYLVDLTKK